MAKPFLSGASMVMIGYDGLRFVSYPISQPDPDTGEALINWIADLMFNVFGKMAYLFIVLIVAAALAGNWQLFVDNLGIMGAGLISLNIALLFIGLGLARISNLSWNECKTISIETGAASIVCSSPPITTVPRHWMR